jgi:hypothetical protein
MRPMVYTGTPPDPGSPLALKNLHEDDKVN